MVLFTIALRGLPIDNLGQKQVFSDPGPFELVLTASLCVSILTLLTAAIEDDARR